MTINKVTLSNIFYYLHRRTQLTNNPTSKRWSAAEHRFLKHHAPFIKGRTNVGWHNKRTTWRDWL